MINDFADLQSGHKDTGPRSSEFDNVLNSSTLTLSSQNLPSVTFTQLGQHGSANAEAQLLTYDSSPRLSSEGSVVVTLPQVNAPETILSTPISINTPPNTITRTYLTDQNGDPAKGITIHISQANLPNGTILTEDIAKDALVHVYSNLSHQRMIDNLSLEHFPQEELMKVEGETSIHVTDEVNNAGGFLIIEDAPIHVLADHSFSSSFDSKSGELTIMDNRQV